MDEELIYPNPVARSDLPVQKPTWPKWVAGITAVLIIGTTFLPQMISSSMGRTVFKVYLGKRLNGDVNFYTFHTSWFGGTEVTEFQLKNLDGNIIGAHRIQSSISLGKLLRGKFELGECVIEQPHIEWVVDYGDISHCDTYCRLLNRTPLPPPGLPAATAPKVSGHVTMINGELEIIRTRVVQKTLLSSFRGMRFNDLQGTFTAKTFADPWQCSVTANVGDEKSQPGTVQLNGVIGCGGTAVFSSSNLRMTMKVEAQNAPTAPVISVLTPVFSPEDAVTALGPTLTNFRLGMEAHDGRMNFDTLEVQGTNGRLSARPWIDLAPYPAWCNIDTPATFAFTVPTGDVRAELMQICPLLSAATDFGNAIITADKMAIPLDENVWRTLSGAGQLAMSNAKLTTVKTRADDQPKGIVTQMALITGDLNPTPTLNFDRLPFTIEHGRVSVGSANLTVGENVVAISGQSEVDKPLAMSVALTAKSKPTAPPPELAQKPLDIPMVGTPDNPHLDFDAAREALPADIKPTFDTYLVQQLALYRTRQAKSEKSQQQRTVEGLIKAFGPNEP